MEGTPLRGERLDSKRVPQGGQQVVLPPPGALPPGSVDTSGEAVATLPQRRPSRSARSQGLYTEHKRQATVTFADNGSVKSGQTGWFGGSSDVSDSQRQSVRLADVKTHQHLQQEQIREVLKSAQGSKRRRLKLPAVLPGCGFFCKASDRPWIDSPESLPVLYGMVLANTVYLVLQTHYLTDDLVYFAVEVGFIVYFAAELGARTWSFGTFFSNPWNVFDLVVLVISVIDVSTLIWISAVRSVHLVVLMLMPLFQIIRLGRWVLELRLIIAGLAHAVRAVVWSMLLLLLLIYFFAVLGNRFVSNAEHFQDNSDVQEWFGTLADALLTLFTMATFEDYQSIIRYFIHSGHGGDVIASALVLFILFANLALLNLVTAVVVDSIIDVLPKKRAEELAQERSRVVNRLEKLFKAMDTDNDEKLTVEEFETAMQNSEDVKNEMSRLQLCSFDIKELFFLIDRQDSGKVSVDQFIEGLLRMTPGEVSRKELLGVQYDLHMMWNMLASGQEQITDMTKKLDADVKKRFTAVERNSEMWTEHIETLTQGLVNALKAELNDGHVRILQSIESTSTQPMGEKIDSMLKNVEEVAKGGQHVAAKVEQAIEASTRHIDWPRLEHMFLDMKEEHRRLLAPLASGTFPARVDASHQAQSEAAAGGSSAGADSTCGPEPEPQSMSGPPLTPPRRISALRSGQPEVSGNLAAECLRHTDRVSTDSSLRASSSQQRQLPPLQRIPLQAAQLEVQQQLQQIQQQLQWQQTQLQQLPLMQSREVSCEQELHGHSNLSFNNLAGPPNSFGADVGARVAGVRRWVMQQGWAKIPFDKLVLHLDHLGIQLSVTEQDLLKRAMREPDGHMHRSPQGGY